MDTKTLLQESKARFNHNSAKDYLEKKYQNKLTVATQGGLWKADHETIGFLNSFTIDELVVIDTFNNPVKVNRLQLLSTLRTLYQEVMNEWYEEWTELEQKR